MQVVTLTYYSRLIGIAIFAPSEITIGIPLGLKFALQIKIFYSVSMITCRIWAEAIPQAASWLCPC